jgi:hypothetical protein
MKIYNHLSFINSLTLSLTRLVPLLTIRVTYAKPYHSKHFFAIHYKEVKDTADFRIKLSVRDWDISSEDKCRLCEPGCICYLINHLRDWFPPTLELCQLCWIYFPKGVHTWSGCYRSHFERRKELEQMKIVDGKDMIFH